MAISSSQRVKQRRWQLPAVLLSYISYHSVGTSVPSSSWQARGKQAGPTHQHRHAAAAEHKGADGQWDGHVAEGQHPLALLLLSAQGGAMRETLARVGE